MAVYIYTYLIMFVTSIFKINKQTIDERNSRRLLLFFVIITILIGLRHPSMGNDLRYYSGYGYLQSFHSIKNMPLRQSIPIFSKTYEVGYILLNKIIGMLGFDEQGLLFFCSVLSIMPVWYVIKDKKTMPFLQCCIFFGVPAFMMYYSALRQGIAMGISFIAFKFVEEKKLIPFVLTVILAMTFHVSAAIMIFVYPIYYFKIGSKNRMFTVILIAVAYLLKGVLFSALGNILALLGYSVYFRTANTGAIGVLLEFAFIYAFCCVYQKESEIQNGYMNILLFACLCQVFASVNWMAMRITDYFMYILMILIPDTLFGISNERDRKLITFAMNGCFLIVGIIYLLGTETSWAMSVPYYFFWQYRPL